MPRRGLGRRLVIAAGAKLRRMNPPALCLLVLALASPARAAVERPNIVLIMTDDHGWYELGCHGNPHISTPVLDRLAGESVEFTRFYASPVCTPTRASLMTGRYYQRTGAIDTYMGRDTMAGSEITLAEILRKAGYRTGIFGKWHLGRYAKYHPLSRGFDEFLGFWQYGFINRYDDSDELFYGRTPVITTGYITDVLTDAAIDFVVRPSSRRSGTRAGGTPAPQVTAPDAGGTPAPQVTAPDAGETPAPQVAGRDAGGTPAPRVTAPDAGGTPAPQEPFFLYLPYNAAHNPFLVPDKYIETYIKKGLDLTTARIYGMITCVDENVGRLLKTLEEERLAERTVVIFMTDNGGVSKYFKAGLRGNKASCFEGGIRVPFMARYPGKFAAGAKVEAMAAHIDVLPTICDLVGATVPQDRPIDGKSILKLMREGRGESPHEYLFHQWNRVKPSPDQSWAVHGKKYKLVNGQLYDLKADPGEEHNLAEQHPEAARELREVFLKWFAEVTANQEYGRVPIEVGRDDENPVEIDVTWGDPTGKVTPQYRHYNRDGIENWTQAGEAVRWKIDVVKPGRYEIVFNYGCDPADGGSTLQLSVGEARIDMTIESTGGRMIWMDRVMGAIDLVSGPATLEITAKTVAGREAVVLHRIWLRRTGGER